MFVRKILGFILFKILFLRTITKQLDFSFNHFFCLKWPIFWKHIFALDCPSFCLFWYWCLQFRRRDILKVMISRLLPARKGFPFRKINEDIVGFASLWPPWETGESLRLHYGIVVVTCFLHGPPPKWMAFFFGASEPRKPFYCAGGPAEKIQIQFADDGMDFFSVHNGHAAS